MSLVASVKVPLVLYNRSANGASKLVPDQVVLQPGCIRKEVIRGEGLHTVVLKKRTVQRLRAGLQHRIRDETSPFSVFGFVRMCDHAVFLNGFRRDRGDRAGSL